MRYDMHVSNILFIRRQRLGKCTCQQSNRSISSAVHFYCLSACFVKFDTHRRELDASDACYSFEIWKSKYLDITSIGIRFLHQGFHRNKAWISNILRYYQKNGFQFTLNHISGLGWFWFLVFFLLWYFCVACVYFYFFFGLEFFFGGGGWG